ncbi:DUF2970 domain-containing protein [Natronosporangium hydrolyticum]|uniref:DUF2970 domain-containing protein n=1 Tax=Natronosporangium hydrolyticum TaxID=2811111 RepID=A0A895YJ87_9ACTN|nr:hypothetical protein [Natronosporangium hydrolyticum]QSB14190.1 DUF2970 domain-containing protein [Natronosporangium hydrolyticum]
MTTPDDDEPTGVWVSAAGPRFEVIRHEAGYRMYVYMFRRGGAPSAERDFATIGQIAKAITNLEQQGYQFDPGREPDSDRTVKENVARQWRSPKHLIGAGILFLVILVCGIVLVVD